jgi:hypothetical protein
MGARADAEADECTAAIARVDDALRATEGTGAETVTVPRADLVLVFRFLVTLMRAEAKRRGLR